MFDSLYNRGAAYWTVFGIRFHDMHRAGWYATQKANATGNPVRVTQFDDDNPNGFNLYTAQPEDTQ